MSMKLDEKGEISFFQEKMNLLCSASEGEAPRKG